MKLHLSVRMRAYDPIVDVGGDVDIATAADLHDFLVTVIRQRGPRLAVHLSGVAFMDSTGLAALLHARQVARDGGGDLTIESVSPSVAFVLEITRAFPVPAAATTPAAPSDTSPPSRPHPEDEQEWPFANR